MPSVERKDIRKLEKENNVLKKLLAEKELEIEIKTEFFKKMKSEKK